MGAGVQSGESSHWFVQHNDGALLARLLQLHSFSPALIFNFLPQAITPAVRAVTPAESRSFFRTRHSAGRGRWLASGVSRVSFLDCPGEQSAARPSILLH